ncbi:ArsR family transcriptional regulator [Dehalogenimonas formicexedens]|uniref:ArsR family transcriptional regulator n=1 Tax=Dehalogenimonas formicexedens TaxID=1839801 RepID=A0A1P8F9U4_9CHLR|nr:metalloregulator ArsR/SmtB family transcription factor [Dehalogenimonas formicexedens]APV45210.1 ArsR family transcriptional regulator [Dehalogenimonas formicexedens]
MRDLIKVFKALSDETRLRVLNLLIHRECCVCEVVQVLGISQTRASRSLSQLYDAGLLDRRSEGLWIIYSLASELKEDYRSLVVKAVGEALGGNPAADKDLKRLAVSQRLCPPADGTPSQQSGVC